MIECMAALVFAPAIDVRLVDYSVIATNPVYGERPLLRGRFHQLGAVLHLPCEEAEGARGRDQPHDGRALDQDP